MDKLIPSWMRHLRAENKAAGTIDRYSKDAKHLAKFLDGREPTPDSIREWLNSLLDSVSPSTAARNYRSVQQFFKWAEIEEEITPNPMRNLRGPRVPEAVVPVIEIDCVKKLIGTCNGKGIAACRDLAILLTFVDTGLRLSELANLSPHDVSLDSHYITVTGKGGRQRLIPIGSKTVRALDRYMRKVDYSSTDFLWVGKKGRLTSNGIYQMLKRRCAKAGIEHINPHRFRHTFAHTWKAGGGNDEDLMLIAGWRSRQMLDRYGRSAASERARSAHRRLSPADNLI